MTEATAVWTLWLLFAIATGITYARIPSGELWGVSRDGPAGGASRALLMLAGPFAPIAAALAIIAFERWRLGAAATSRARTRTFAAAVVVAVTLCLTVALPGATDRDELDFRISNLPAAAGVGLAFVLTIRAAYTTGIGATSGWTNGDWARLIVLGTLFVIALPWLVAVLGFFASQVPLLGWIFLAAEPTPGEPGLPAVHVGYHEGLGGVLHAASALVLSRTLGSVRPRAAAALSLYFSLIFVYGLAVAASDAWYEQVVKRGWASWRLPDVLVPSLGAAWAMLLFAAVVVHLLLFRPRRSTTEHEA